MQREQDFGAQLDRSAATLSRLVSPVSTPSHCVMRHEATVALAQRLAQLPDHYREVIILRHLRGMSIAEVAAQLQKTPEATNSLLARALVKLRVLMKESK